MPSVADIIIHRLVEAGVQTLFGMPGGGSNLDLIEAAGRAGFPFVMSHTETAGALMACAQAELTGKPGACLATLGPGVASMVNGAAHAWLDRVPLILLTDGIATAGRDTYQHQRLDHAAIFAPVTKASLTIAVDCADEIVERALTLATSSPPGPVHLDLAPDVSREQAVHRRTASNQESDIGEADPARFSRGRRRPLVIVGLGASNHVDADAVRSFCERHAIPALVTYKAKGVIPDDHPLFAGVFTNGAIERPLVEQADLIIGVGLDPVEFLPRPWEYRAPVVLCNRWMPQQRHVPIAASFIGDIAGGISFLDYMLPSGTDWQGEAIASQASRQREALRVRSEGWAPWQAVEAAHRAAGSDVTVTVDAGAHMFPITALWPARRPRQMLISNGLSTMAFALPSAIGAALSDRSRRVFALTGDGGMLMCLAELGTAAREQLPITVVVFNDRSLSLIEIKQQKMRYPRAGVALDGVDWQAAAATFGVPSWRATNDREIQDAIQRASAIAGPALVEAVVDPSSYPETLRAVRG